MQCLILVVLLFGASLGFIYEEPVGYVNRHKGLIFEYYAIHKYLIIRDMVHKECWLVVASPHVDKLLLKNKKDRYFVEDAVIEQIHSHTAETKMNLHRENAGLIKYITGGECRHGIMYSLKFVLPAITTTTTTRATTVVV